MLTGTSIIPQESDWPCLCRLIWTVSVTSQPLWKGARPWKPQAHMGPTRHHVPTSPRGRDSPVPARRPPSSPHFQKHSPRFNAHLEIGPAYGRRLAHSFSCWKDEARDSDKETPFRSPGRKEKPTVQGGLLCGLSFPPPSTTLPRDSVKWKPRGSRTREAPQRCSIQRQQIYAHSHPSAPHSHGGWRVPVTARISSEFKWSLRTPGAPLISGGPTQGESYCHPLRRPLDRRAMCPCHPPPVTGRVWLQHNASEPQFPKL